MVTNILEQAQKELGYTERGNNNNKYGAYFNTNGVSWCALFVSYCLELTKNPLFYHLKDKKGNMRIGACYSSDGKVRANAYCPSIQEHFKENGKLFKADPKPSDIVLFCWDKSGIPDHIGIVEKYNKETGYLTTIEGNTSSGTVGSQDNGDGVYRRQRHISLTCGFIRPK